MGREYKIVHKAYAAWENEKEIAALNKESENGWQLIKGKCFSSKFKWNPEVRYRYQLDHQNKIEELGRYIETFREQGWEYVNTTFNGWSYFRKPYDPKLPEDEYEIFTDASSKEEMHQSWIKVFMFFVILCVISTIYNIWQCIQLPTLPFKCEVIVSVVTAVLLIAFLVLLRNPKTRHKMKLGYIIAVVFFVWCSNVAIFQLQELRPFVRHSHIGEVVGPLSADMENAMGWMDFDVAYDDCYFMDLDIEADTPVTFVLVNEANEVLYKVREANYTEENYRFDLVKGKYQIYFMDFEQGSLYVHMDLH